MSEDNKWSDRRKELQSKGFYESDDDKAHNEAMQELIRKGQNPKGERPENAMSPDDAQAKGRDILALMADLYQQIEWESSEEDGDPYLKMTFYKSGKFTLETYKDDEVAEFTIDEITKN